MSDLGVDAVGDSGLSGSSDSIGRVSSLGSGSGNGVSNAGSGSTDRISRSAPNDPPQSSAETFAAAMAAARVATEQRLSGGTNTPPADLNAARLGKVVQGAGGRSVSSNHWPAQAAFASAPALQWADLSSSGAKLSPTHQVPDGKETARTHTAQTMNASARTKTARTRAPAITAQQVADVVAKAKPAGGVSPGDKATTMGRPKPDSKPANAQSTPPAAQPPVSKADTSQQPQMPNVFVALMQGIWHGGRDLAQTGTALRGGRPEGEGQRSVAAAPMQWGDLLSPVSKLAPKLAYQLGQSWPTMAGGIVGGSLGVAAVGGPEDPAAAVTGPVGGALGAGMMNGLQTFGNYFGEELKQTPSDPDGAYSRALGRAKASGTFSGVAWALFPVRAFQGPVKNAMFQAFGVQPALSMGHQATDNALTGRPLSEGLGNAYTQGAINTLPTAGAHYLGGKAGAFASQYELQPDPKAFGANGANLFRIGKKTAEPVQAMKGGSTEPASTRTARSVPAQADPKAVAANRSNIAKKAETGDARTGERVQRMKAGSTEPASTNAARTRAPAQTRAGKTEANGIAGLRALAVNPNNARAKADAVKASVAAMERAKTSASTLKSGAVASDGISTRSGWTQKLPEGYGSVSPETIRDYSKKIGHTLTAKGAEDHVGEQGGFPGKSRASDAEKQLAMAQPDHPIGVSKPMCSDCRNWFEQRAKYEGKPSIVTDPEFTRIFWPNGRVEHIRVKK